MRSALRNTAYATATAATLLGLAAPAAHAATSQPAATTRVTANAHGTTVDVNWAKVPGAAGYVVTIATSQMGNGLETTHTSAAFTDLGRGNKWTVTVYALDAAGEHGPGLSTAVATAPGTTRVKVTTSTSTATATWAPAPAASAYKVTLARGTHKVVSFITHARQTTFTHLRQHYAYTVTVVPVNAAGRGGATVVTAATR